MGFAVLLRLYIWHSAEESCSEKSCYREVSACALSRLDPTKCCCAPVVDGPQFFHVLMWNQLDKQ